MSHDSYVCIMNLLPRTFWKIPFRTFIHSPPFNNIIIIPTLPPSARPKIYCINHKSTTEGLTRLLRFIFSKRREKNISPFLYRLETLFIPRIPFSRKYSNRSLVIVLLLSSTPPEGMSLDNNMFSYSCSEFPFAEFGQEMELWSKGKWKWALVYKRTANGHKKRSILHVLYLEWCSRGLFVISRIVFLQGN